MLFERVTCDLSQSYVIWKEGKKAIPGKGKNKKKGMGALGRVEAEYTLWLGKSKHTIKKKNLGWNF